MRRLLLSILALTLAAPIVARAQAKPDFSGTWTLNMEKSDPAPAGRGGGGGGRGPAGPVEIKQTAADITIGMITYKLDGVENTMQLQGRGGPQEAKVTAKWDGTKLVIVTKRDVNGMAVTATDVRTLSADGKEMTVQTTNTTPAGDQMRKTVFTKS
jgi:hypothetical protein